ncbi:MAG: sulfotransferase domain-containing protein [Thermoanaerobaculales bacterium]|nr:sulfotransferase domain-containing protein [Thermoanaerobaculales bacterium]
MSLWLGAFMRKIKYGKSIVLVSGLPRSGTSMAMKMLDAGGLDLIQDGIRTADEDNPKGYFEDERVKDLAKTEDKRWLKNVRGKVIKVVSSLLQYLPPENHYKVVFMRRELQEVLASQAKMLKRREEKHAASDEDMVRMYEQHLDKVGFQLRFRRNFDVLFLKYRDVLADPLREAERMNEFFGGKLDIEKMVGVVDPALYRNRAEKRS